MRLMLLQRVSPPFVLEAQPFYIFAGDRGASGVNDRGK
jgi:hypothetical protein